MPPPTGLSSALAKSSASDVCNLDLCALLGLCRVWVTDLLKFAVSAGQDLPPSPLFCKRVTSFSPLLYLTTFRSSPTRGLRIGGMPTHNLRTQFLQSTSFAAIPLATRLSKELFDCSQTTSTKTERKRMTVHDEQTSILYP